jgi:hypothetical protein
MTTGTIFQLGMVGVAGWLGHSHRDWVALATKPEVLEMLKELEQQYVVWPCRVWKTG